jgi:hypothetical protein
MPKQYRKVTSQQNDQDIMLLHVLGYKTEISSSGGDEFPTFQRDGRQSQMMLNEANFSKVAGVLRKTRFQCLTVDGEVLIESLKLVKINILLTILEGGLCALALGLPGQFHKDGAP